MSIVIAVVAEDQIVIGADTICMAGDDTAHYNDRHSKLYRASNPKFAIGLAGSKGADRFLRQRVEWSSLDFDATLLEYKDSTFLNYKNGNTTYDFYYLICGYDKSGESRLERVRFERDHYNNGNPVSDIVTVGPKHAIGIEKHGAWYVLANYYRPRMKRDDAMLFVYLCLREVIRHDERTRGPIEMMLVYPNREVYQVPDVELNQLKQETENRLGSVTSIFTAPYSLS